MHKMSESSEPISEEVLDNDGKEICSHDGILLKQASEEYRSVINTSGSLNILESPNNKNIYIEWRPNENILVADETALETDWSLVDTIQRRQRTTSESMVFNVKGETVTPRPKTRIRVALKELAYIEVIAKGHNIRLRRKDDHKIHSEFFFQHGNPDSFVGALRQLHVLENIRNPSVYNVRDPDSEKLQKTFDTLKIDEIKSSSNWFANIGFKNKELLARVIDFVPHTAFNPGLQSPTRHDEYEVLNTEKEDAGAEKLQDAEEPNIVPLPDRSTFARGSPLTEKQWREFQTEDGRISDPQRIKEIIFRGGIHPELRSEVWKYILNYYLWDETRDEGILRSRKKTCDYYRMKAQWLSMSSTQERNFSGYRERKCQIEKDVKRTDRTLEFFAGEDNPHLGILQDILMTYVMYNYDLGYVQGMSDLLAPMLANIQFEPDAFWCFVGFMDIVYMNFDIDQAGMKRQLKDLNCLLKFSNYKLYRYLENQGSDNMYFCFRWLLVWFKREFSSTDILELWECLWTGLPCPNFHLFVCLAILDEQMEIIINSQYEFNEILKHVNELSLKIDIRKTLEVAEAIYEQIKSSDNLTDDIRLIIGEQVTSRSDDSTEQEFEDNFDEMINEPTLEEIELKQRKLDEACEQSMNYSFF